MEETEIPEGIEGDWTGTIGMDGTETLDGASAGGMLVMVE